VSDEVLIGLAIAYIAGTSFPLSRFAPAWLTATLAAAGIIVGFELRNWFTP
jgi:hypothetical protein